MKWFMIFLAIGLVASDKLDRTYLPPAGAQFSGGNLGDRDVPLAPPDNSHQIPGHEGSQTNFGLNGEPLNFGDKIPKVPFSYYPEQVPTTTTSYAFSQTTTYPPAENYETTALPINPVTGFPVNFDQANNPRSSPQGQPEAQNVPNYDQNQGQAIPSYGTNIQPNVGPTSVSPTFGSQNYVQPVNQPLSQYPGQNTIAPGGSVGIPGTVYQTTNQNQGPIRYPGGQNTPELQGFPGSGVPGSNDYENYPGQKVVNPNEAVRVPGGDQSLGLSDEQITGQQRFGPSTTSPTNIPLDGNQYDGNYDGSQRQIPQEAYLDQPGSQQNQASYQNPQNIETSSAVPSSYYNNVSGTTPIPSIPSSTSAYFSVSPVYRPERPQAAADRNAVILNYENIRTPNSYSYSFDTSNGIHADESGIVDNGTKAQGAYSYIGDDGKLYSVIYTADENGFQPRGDHLPTPPPIPEAIKQVIEQAAKDKEAGIIDDGSYDEAKYGDKKYQVPTNRRRLQNLKSNQVDNQPFGDTKDNNIKPVTGINDEYDESEPQDQFISGLPVTESRKQELNKNIPLRPLDDKINGNNVSGGNEILSGNDAPSGDLDNNGTPIIKSSYPKDGNQSNHFRVKNRRPSVGTPALTGVKDIKTDYPETGQNRYYDRERQGIDSGSPREFNRSGQIINTKNDGVTGAPVKTTQKQRVKGNRRPSTKITAKNNNGRLQNNVFDKETNDTPAISDYLSKTTTRPSLNEQIAQQDDSGYYYQPPNTKFEQTKFPSRFNTQEVSSNSNPNQRKTELNKSTTRQPFITPNVYSQNDETRQLTTRRPFITKGVTSPVDSYEDNTDYDDGDDYGTDQDIDDEGINSSKNPNEKTDSTYRPYQQTSTSLKPQYNPDVQSTRVTQKDSVNPGVTIENSGTIAPGYSVPSTTPMPSHSSRFGTTENPHQNRPSAISDNSAAVGRPVTSPIPSRTSDYKYKTTGPVNEYHDSSVVPGYPATGVVPGYDLGASTPGVTGPQSYAISTYGPSKSYSSTTATPATSVYNTGYGAQTPSSTPGVYQTSGSFHTGYHYGPPMSGYSLNVSPNTGRPDLTFFTPSGTPGSYQPGSNVSPSTTLAPITPGRSDPFTQSQQGNTAPVSSPIGIYQGNVQYKPSTSNYSTVGSTPVGRPVFGYPGPSTPTYSTTGLPSTVRATPGSFTLSSAPTQGYSTTYQPGLQTSKDTFITGPVVDGFGRPITVELGGSYPGFRQDTKGPISTEGPKFVGADQSTAYPDQTRVIGEDFSGPKQPQRYDPKTGYHYK